jgi:hypothetical protein
MYSAALVVARGWERRLIVIALAYSVVFLGVSLGIRGGAAEYILNPASLPGGRYTIIPLWMCYTALIVAAGLPFLRPGGAGERLPRWLQVSALPVLAVALLALQLAVNYTGGGGRTGSTSWRQGVIEARETCRLGVVGKRTARELPLIARPVLVNKDTVLIPVAPWQRGFWSAPIRCADLGP